MSKKIISLRLDADLWAKATEKAWAERKSLTALIQEALEKALEAPQDVPATPVADTPVEPVPAPPERLRELDRLLREKTIRRAKGWDPLTGKEIT